jgi:diaminohydroxyphosphoribosylaminopyrimidine deaminase/5-amino-6-(5-phosphoribosylamino)uracil reductase
MERLGQKGITSVFIEGGSEVNASAVKDRIVDKFLFFVAPKLITGNNAKGPIGGCGIETMDKAISLKDVTVNRIGPDIFVEAYPDW